MKTLTRRLSLTLAGIVVASIAAISQANAQYNPTGDDGITASPKLRAQLNERKAARNPVSVTIPTMACPTCKDNLVNRKDGSARGANQPVIQVASHLCKTCNSTTSLVGQGKAKREVVTHKCAAVGTVNLVCCKINTATPKI